MKKQVEPVLAARGYQYWETINNYESRIIEKFVLRIRPGYANEDANPMDGAVINNNGDIKDDKKDNRTSD